MYKKRVKNIICLICSAGGHLTELRQFKSAYSKHKHFFITFKRSDTKELNKKNKVYFIDDPSRNPIRLFKSLFQTFKILKKEKPKIILTTGAGVAVPACYLGKFLFGTKIIYVESVCRITKPSLSGRLVYPIADKFLVQWKPLLKKYGDKAIYKGSIL